MSSLQRVDSFGVVLPDGWIAVPAEPALFEQFVGGLRARWRQSPEWDRALERQAETLLARTRHELTRVGCVLAALYMDEVLDDSETYTREVPEVVLMAACTLGVHTKAEFGTQMSLSIPVLYSAMVKRPTERGEQQRFGRITNVTRPEVVDMRAGRAVHLRRLYEPRKLGLKTEPVFAESFIWPIGDDGEGCCVLQFATTNTDQARPFSELFGAIANTFRMFEPDQPTSFE